MQIWPSGCECALLDQSFHYEDEQALQYLLEHESAIKWVNTEMVSGKSTDH